MFTYSFEDVVCYLGGLPVTEYAPGDGLTVVYDGVDWNKHQGSHGATGRSKQLNYLGTLTIKIIQGSRTNGWFSQWVAEDRRTGLAVKDCMVKDNRGATIITALRCYPNKHADQGFANDLGQREWVFDLHNLEINEGEIFET